MNSHEADLQPYEATVRRRFYHRRRFWLIILFIALMATAWELRSRGYLEIELIRELIHQYPAASILLFGVIYALSIVCLIPTLPFNLLSGVIWGGILGGFISTAGCAAGELLAFLLVRHMTYRPVPKLLQAKMAVWTSITDSVRSNAVLAIAIVRLNPFFPSAPASFFFGLTRLPTLTYAVWNTVFIFPPTLAVSLLGAGSTPLLQGDTPSGLNTIATVFASISILLAGYFVTRILVRRLKK